MAGDTFRAAAIEQLALWGERAGVPVVRQKSGSDPSAVAFDAIDAALARGHDVVIMDTAGRMHTKVNLMEEVKKLQRVITKKLPEDTHEVLLVLDATTGQNALSQARQFKSELGITGLVLTKLDGTAKGGVVAVICQELQGPVRFITASGKGLTICNPLTLNNLLLPFSEKDARPQEAVMLTALDGVRILDLSRLLPGPFCSMLLADMGADVIKVEDPKGGDYIRWWPPLLGKNSFHVVLNRNKRSLTLARSTRRRRR